MSVTVGKRDWKYVVIATKYAPLIFGSMSKSVKEHRRKEINYIYYMKRWHLVWRKTGGTL